MSNRFVTTIAALLLISAAAPTQARCACACIGGERETVCTTSEEAARSPDLCASSTLDCGAALRKLEAAGITQAGRFGDGCRTVVVEGFGERKLCRVDQPESDEHEEAE